MYKCSPAVCTDLLVSGVISILIGLAFGISGFKALYLLKQHFIIFYNRYSFLLNVASFGLSLPVIIRGILYLLKFNHKFYEWERNNYAAFEIINHIFCHLIPLTC